MSTQKSKPKAGSKATARTRAKSQEKSRAKSKVADSANAPDLEKSNRTSTVPSGEAVPVGTGSHVYLVDGSGYIFRAFHALPPLTRPSDGLPVGAVHGFCAMLWKLLKETKESEAPTHIAVIFDAGRETFRNEIYADYKANRPPPPEELVPQFPLIRDAVQAFNVASLERDGFEADDLIASYAREIVDAGGDVTIVSSDKDLMQLIRPGVAMFDTMKNKAIEPDDVEAKFGVTPDKVIDVQALAGDSSDNVPGVPGIGVKTAAELIATYGDLDTLLDNAEEIKQPKRRERLIEFADQARISRDLVTLRDDAPLDVAADALGVQDPDADRLLGFLQAMEFNTLTRRIAEALGVDPPPVLEKSVGSTLKTSASGKRRVGSGPSATEGTDGVTPEAGANQVADHLARLTFDRERYETITTEDALNAWLAEICEHRVVAFDTETDNLDAMRANLVGVSFATEPGKACYVPLGHRGGNVGDSFDFADDSAAPPQLDLDEVIARIKPALEDRSVLKVMQNGKYDALVLKRYGIDVVGVDDTMLMSYALDAGRGKHNMDDLAMRHLGHACLSFSKLMEAVPGKKKSEKSFAQVPIADATAYAAEDADVTLRLWMLLKARLASERMSTVYETLERPLAPVIVDMELAGIEVDRKILARLSNTFAERAGRLETRVYELAGETFNLASPKQLGELLFDHLKLPGGKKTKSGQWETRANLLDDLAANEELPEDARELVHTMIEWRQLTKLRSTYTDALPNFINPETGRIHTSYALAATTTGRLASSDPNLQNIPIRTKEGREIRTAFVAPKKHVLISADYSQIELRVLAHIADIPQLKKAFDDGLDIHAMTASEMFGVPVKDMPGEVRRRAKAINFGIIYGISAFGLANQLSISRQEAGDYIKTYFKRFPGIKDYMEATKKAAHDTGFVETIFGRRMHYPQINTKNPSMRGFLERAAINAPIQGSAADIIRRAMIRMPHALQDAGLQSTRMLLQVHDELIFEAPKSDADAVIKVVQAVMEQAPEPAVQLSVPLQVDAHSASNWDEAH